MFLHDYNSALKYGAKILGSEIIGNDIVGAAYYVRPYTGDDTAAGNSSETAFKTLSHALSAATANHGDTVFLVHESNTAASTTDYQSAALDWNKDGVNLIGIGGDGGSIYLGQRSRISNLSTAACPAVLFTVSANNCVIAGLEIFHQNGVADLSTAEIAMEVSGTRNAIVNCQISGVGHAYLDTVGSASLRVSGSENYFKNCYIGLDTILRGECLSEVRIGTEAGAGGTRNIFEDCIINSWTSQTTFKAILFLNASAHTFTLLKNTIMSAEQGGTGYGTPTGAIDPGSVSRPVAMVGGAIIGYTNVVTANSTLVQVASWAGGLVDEGRASNVLIA